MAASCLIAGLAPATQAAFFSHNFQANPEKHTLKVKVSGFCQGSFVATLPAGAVASLGTANSDLPFNAVTSFSSTAITEDGHVFTSFAMGLNSQSTKINKGKLSLKSSYKSVYTSVAAQLPNSSTAAVTCDNGQSLADIGGIVPVALTGAHRISASGKDGNYRYQVSAKSTAIYDAPPACTATGFHGGDVNAISNETYAFSCKPQLIKVTFALSSKGTLTP